LSLSDQSIAAASTPSDISYNTVQEIRSPSPYKQNIDSPGGLLSQLERGQPPSFSPPQTFGRVRSLQNTSGIKSATILVEDGNVFEGQSPAPFTAPPSPAPSQRHEFHIDISSILVEDGNVFEGQSPAPFTAPPSPAPPQRHGFHGASSGSSQHLVLGENFVDRENDIHAPSSSSIAAVAGAPSIETRQKKRYLQKEELEFTQRLNDFQLKYGPDHLATVDTASRLAKIFHCQDRYRSAERLYRYSAEALQKSVGENDPRTLWAFALLSSVFLAQSQFSKAKTLLQVVHSKACRVLHPSHLDLLKIKNELANCLALIGNLVEAEQIFREVLVLGGETLPPDNEMMISTMMNLSDALEDQAKYSQAEKITKVVYETSVLNGNLNRQLLTRGTLARLSLLKGEFQKAVEASREVLAAQKQLFGPEHRNTIITQQYLAEALHEIGRMVESEELLRDTINKFAKTLGRNHTETLRAELSLAQLFYKQHRFGEAEELQKHALSVSQEVYGLASNLTRLSAGALGTLYHHQGRLEEAHSTMETAFRGALELLGPDHRITRSYESRLSTIAQEREQLQRPQDGASMILDDQHQIAVGGIERAPFGAPSSGLDGNFQPFEGYMGLYH
jgi:tetratricopeptide (TPR) repeat protein